MKNIQLNIELDEQTPECIITDGTKLHRVLLNLIGNAIKFTDQGFVTIKIESHSIEEGFVQLKFSVIDTGIGIPEALKTKIFDRFFRAIPSYKSKHSGYGIGLHVAQKHLSLLGGEINFESEVGKGSTFYFTLTTRIGYKTSIAPSTNPINAQISNNTITRSPLLLLVEDNMISLHMIEGAVEQAGYKFFSAIDGEHAVELFETNDFDLILTDVGISGPENKHLVPCIRELEQKMNKKQTPIIGLTTNTLAKNEGLRLGMNKIITMPVLLEDVREAILELISG
jgi:CheY-like chemotaxis protein